MGEERTMSEEASNIILRLDEVEAKYPKLFARLRQEGWYPSRQVEPSPDEIARGLIPHKYSDAFLRSFSGIRLTQDHARPRGRPYTVRALLGFDASLERIDPGLSSACIHELAGTTFVYPVFDAEMRIGFALEDGRLLLLDSNFQGYAWADDPFAALEWYLFKDQRHGLAMEYLPKDQRPFDFQDLD